MVDISAWLAAGNLLAGMPSNPKGYLDLELEGQLVAEARELLAEAPTAPATDPAPPEGFALYRPRDMSQLVRAASACVAHVPWTSQEAGERYVQGRYGRPWSNALLVYGKGGLCGVAVVGPFYDKMALCQFGLVEALRGPGADQIVGEVLDALGEYAELEWVVVDEPYRAAFEARRYGILLSRHRLFIPLVERPIREGFTPKPMSRREVETFVTKNRRGVECALERVLEDASFSVEIDGELVGAIIVSEGPGEDSATLEEVYLVGAHRHSGWAAALGQSSINGVIRHGITHYEAWEGVENKSIRPMNEKFGVTYQVPHRQYARKLPDPG